MRRVAALVLLSGLCYTLFRVTPRLEDRAVLTGPRGRELLGRALPRSPAATTEFNALEAIPAVDNSPPLNETDLVVRLQPHMPHQPLCLLYTTPSPRD